MFVPQNKQTAKSSHNSPQATRRGVSTNPPAPEIPIQATFLPGRLTKNTRPYILESEAMVPVPKITLRVDQDVLIDDEHPIVKGSENDREVWYRAYANGIETDFWLKEGFFEWSPRSVAFERLMDMFEDCWDGKLLEDPDYHTPFDSLKKNLFSHYTTCIKRKSHINEQGQNAVAEELRQLFLTRAEDCKLRLSCEDRPPHNYTQKELAELTDIEHFRLYFLILTGRESLEGVKGRRKPTVVAEQDVPYKYVVFLNVQGKHLLEVMKDLLPLMDNPKDKRVTDIHSITVAPLRNLNSRPDTICIKVVTEEGFENLKKFLVNYTESFRHAFVDDPLFLTERFAKGASWSLDLNYMNVWIMDERMEASANRFLTRVDTALTKYRRDPPFFDFKSDRWEALRLAYIKAKNAMRPTKGQSNYSALKELNKHALGLKIEGLSGQVEEWISHFEVYKKRSSYMTFFSGRTTAFADLINEQHTHKPTAMRSLMTMFEKRGMDFFRPYTNLPESPYKDDTMVVISEHENMGLEGGFDEISSPMAVPLPPLPKKLTKEEKQKPSGATALPPNSMIELPTIHHTGLEDEIVRDDELERVYMGEFSETRQKKKTSVPKHEAQKPKKR